MTHRVIVSPEAQSQLLSLYRYIAAENSPEVARRFTAAILEHCEKLQSFPLRGTPRDDLRKGLRTIAFRRRVTIAYSVDALDVAILGIFYGGQDLKAALDIIDG